MSKYDARWTGQSSVDAERPLLADSGHGQGRGLGIFIGGMAAPAP